MYKYHKDGSKPINGEIFVFGSNLAGIHGAGAARLAYNSFGAEWNKGIGLSGLSYAIPTKDESIKTLPLIKINIYVVDFLNFARDNPDKEFFLTRVGCGLAGWSDWNIAPLFKNAPCNIIFPEQWKVYIED